VHSVIELVVRVIDVQLGELWTLTIARWLQRAHSVRQLTLYPKRKRALTATGQVFVQFHANRRECKNAIVGAYFVAELNTFWLTTGQQVVQRLRQFV
jgi:hypothetical protein